MRLALALVLLASCASPRRVIGETAVFQVEGLSIRARVDTGAARSSVHAVDVRVPDGSVDMKENVGKPVRFTLVGDGGEALAVTAAISGVQTVKNAQGVERRYLVPLALTWGGVTKTVGVNLRDRAGMGYRLLVGRDWLKGTAVVDPSKSER